MRELRHIVFLTSGFAENEHDTANIPAMQDYLNTLRKALPDANLTIIAFQFPFTGIPYSWNGFDVIPLGGNNNKIKKPFIWLKALHTLKKLHSDRRIDAVHSFWISETALVGQRFCRKNGLRHIITAMGRDTRKGNGYLRFLKSEKFVTLSDRHRAGLLDNHRIDSVVIPWDLGRCEFPEIQPADIDILGVGSVTEIKNYPDFLAAVALIAKHHPNLKVEIIGDGDRMDSVRELSETLRLDKTVTFCGKLTRAETLRKMARAKVLLHTSRYESFGYVFAEALHSGMHVVSCPVGEAMQNERWSVADSVPELAQSALAALQNPAERKRVRLHPEGTTLNAYLKSYAEK